MDQEPFAELETMTTGDIAAAVDARKPWLSLQYMFWCMLHNIGISIFSIQYFIFIGIDMLWCFIAFLCAIIVEILTNRFTIKIYSTYEMVDLLMKRATVERTENKVIRYVILLAPGIFLVGYILAYLEVSLYLCVTLYFISMLMIIIVIKCTDAAAKPNFHYFIQTKVNDSRFYVALNYSIARYGFAVFRPWIGLYTYPGGVGLLMLLCMIVPVPFSLFIHFKGGIGIVESKSQIAILYTLIISFIGWRMHCPARFCLVQREMDRMAAKWIQGHSERNGEVR